MASALFTLRPIAAAYVLECSITWERMMAVLNINAPNIDPKGIRAVESESLLPAIMAVSTSGAPLANAKNVTPANVYPISMSLLCPTKWWNELGDATRQELIG